MAETIYSAISAHELARLLRVSYRTFWRHLPVLKQYGLVELPRFGRRRAFARSSVERLLEGKTPRRTHAA